MTELLKYPSEAELREKGPQKGHPFILGDTTGGVIDHVDNTHVYSGVMKVRSDALSVFVTQGDGGAEWQVTDLSAVERIGVGMPDWQLEALGRGEASI